MMRFRALAAVPFVYSIVFVALVVLLSPATARADFLAWQRPVLRVLALAACAAAAAGMKKGDALRRAWTLLGCAMALFLARDVAQALLPGSDSAPPSPWLANGTLLAGKIALLLGNWELARTWGKLSALADVDPARIRIVRFGVAVLALVVAGSAVMRSGVAVATGGASIDTMLLFVASVVDILSLWLLGPLVLVAIALRGGVFAWPWALVTTSVLAWLLLDAAVNLGLTAEAGFPFIELARAFGMNLLFAAGIAQALAIRTVRERSLGSAAP